MAAMQPGRRGISLMEVLISIGILAIGLSSVVALIPAARSQATRAVILDRAAALAANALADAATFGLLRPDSLTVVPTLDTPVVVDPAFTTSALTNTVSGSLRAGGIYASGATGSAAAAAVHRLVTEARDDIVVAPPAAPDDPPLEQFAGGVRSYEGRMSCLLCLRAGTAAAAPGWLSAVVFHGRDLSAQAVTGTIANFEVTVGPPPVAIKTTKAAYDIIWELNRQNGAVVEASGTLAKTYNPPSMTLQEDLRSPSTVPRGILSIIRKSGAVAAGETVAFVQPTQPLINGRTFRDIVKPGVVLWEPQGRRFHQVVAATPTSISPAAFARLPDNPIFSGTSFFLTLVPSSPIFSGPSPVPVQFLPDSVGLAERPFLPEATTPYTE